MPNVDVDSESTAEISNHDRIPDSRLNKVISTDFANDNASIAREPSFSASRASSVVRQRGHIPLASKTTSIAEHSIDASIAASVEPHVPARAVSPGPRSPSFTRPPSLGQAPPNESVACDSFGPFEHESPGEFLDWKDPEVAGQWALNHHQRNILRKHDVSLPPGLNRFPKLPTKKAASDEEKKPGEASTAREGNGVLVVNFAELQRMRLRKLQIKLIIQSMEMHYTGKESIGWEETLQQYIQTLRDNDYMHSCVSRPRDPFIATSRRSVDADVLKSALGSLPDEIDRRAIEDFNFAEPFDKGRAQPIGGTRLDSYKNARWQRFLENVGMAAVGGGFLIGPMWLMVLHNTLYTVLATTSACVLVFGIVMAWVLQDRMNVLSVTAAYAAVLVVFVGTSTGSS